MNGFDDLIAETDRSVKHLGMNGFAQIGHSDFEPKHLKFERFIKHGEFVAKLKLCELFITHAGVGTVTDGLRAQRRMIIVPRRSRVTNKTPINDQLAFARKIKEIYSVDVLENLADLSGAIEMALMRNPPCYPAEACEAPRFISRFLASS